MANAPGNMNYSLHIPSPLLLVNIPTRRNRESGEMETAIPAERKPLFRGMETGHQCAYNVVMRFAQIHYTFQMSADYAEFMEEEYWNTVNSLDLVDASGLYDPSANGESLKDFIAYFDNWYQYGDLNAESIRIYGDGTWEFYNSLNEDGTGGYLFDSGTFMTSGKTALQLYSADGSYVADVSLNEYGDLILTPVVPGYGNFYEATAFIRESESVAHEAQPPVFGPLTSFLQGARIQTLSGDLRRPVHPRRRLRQADRSGAGRRSGGHHRRSAAGHHGQHQYSEGADRG